MSLPTKSPAQFGVTQSDRNYTQVLSLQHFDSSSFTDSISGVTWAVGSANASYSTAASKFGTGSLFCAGAANGYLRSSAGSRGLAANDFTVEMWVNVTSFPAYSGTNYVNNWTANLLNYGITNTDNHTNSLACYIAGSSGTSGIVNMSVQARNGSGATGGTAGINSSITVPTAAFGTWNHYAVCRKGSVFYLFWNGQLMQTVTGQTFTFTDASNYVLQLGALMTTNYEYPLNGYIDDFRLTVGVARYTQSFTPPSQSASYPITDLSIVWPTPATHDVVSATSWSVSVPQKASSISYSKTSGNLPSWITLDSHTGLSGTSPTPDIYDDPSSPYVSVISATDGVRTTNSTQTFNVWGVDPNVANTKLLIHAEDGTGSTTLHDSSSNNLTLTLGTGGTVSTAQKKFGNSSIALAGTNSTSAIIQSAANPAGMNIGSNDFTMEAWVYITGLTQVGNGYRAVVCALKVPGTLTSTSDWAWSLEFIGSSASLITTLTIEGYSGATQVATASMAINSTVSASLFNSWHHIALTRASGTSRFFLDGVLQTTTGTTGTLAYPSGATLQVGGLTYTGYSGNFKGYMDELRITNGTARYTSNFSVPTGPFASH